LVNAMLWFRGFRQDWDDNMPQGWKSGDVESEMEWLETRLGIMTFQGHKHELGKLAVEAAQNCGLIPEGGLGKTAPEEEGDPWNTPGPMTNVRLAIDKNGKRTDVYRALGANQSRITILRGTAEKLLFEHPASDTPRATGLALKTPNGSTKEIQLKDKKKGEIVLCCGAIDSPKLLQLSGIGPPKLLNSLQIPIVNDLAGVGEGLKDHTMFPLAFEISQRPKDLSLNSIAGFIYHPDKNVQIIIADGAVTPFGLRHNLTSHFYELPPANSTTEQVKRWIQLGMAKFMAFLLETLVAWMPSFRSKLETNLTLLVCSMKPKSAGSVYISSRDPAVAPCIDPAFFKVQDDIQTALWGVAQARSLVKTEPLASIVGAELTDSGPEERENLARYTAPYHHSTGTCAMGRCLDDQLRVQGIRGLRVADASSLPFHPRVPTNASAMTMGAKCASLIAAVAANA
jgi:choline dehydrogenase-like flavoprotein